MGLMGVTRGRYFLPFPFLSFGGFFPFYFFRFPHSPFASLIAHASLLSLFCWYGKIDMPRESPWYARERSHVDNFGIVYCFSFFFFSFSFYPLHGRHRQSLGEELGGKEPLKQFLKFIHFISLFVGGKKLIHRCWKGRKSTANQESKFQFNPDSQLSSFAGDSTERLQTSVPGRQADLPYCSSRSLLLLPLLLLLRPTSRDSCSQWSSKEEDSHSDSLHGLLLRRRHHHSTQRLSSRSSSSARSCSSHYYTHSSHPH